MPQPSREAAPWSLGDLNFCFRNDGACRPGCQADLGIDRVDVLPEAGRLRIRAQFDTDVDVPVEFDPILLPPVSCSLNVTAEDTVADAIISMGIDAATRLERRRRSGDSLG